MFLIPHTPNTRILRQIRRWALLGTFLLAISSTLPIHAQTDPPTTNLPRPVQLHIPLVTGGLESATQCLETSNNSYTALSIVNEPRRADPPPVLDPDLNLFIRGYKVITGSLALVDINGPTDDDAPQLAHLFRPARVPTFRAVYQVHDWNWECRVGGCLGAPISFPEVSLLEMETEPAEPLYPPARQAGIGGDYIALVLYAEKYRLTLTYTREDTPAHGYVVHVENVCVDPSLLALYRETDKAGRKSLPALRDQDIIGTALGEGILVAVRDSGSFMDPRSAKDWWQDTVRALIAAQSEP